MRKGWSIGKHRVEVEILARLMTVRVDGASPPVLALRSNLLGTWPLTVGKRVVELRRVRSIDVARSELWMDGVKVPNSLEPIPWRRAAADARCKCHPLSAASYRSPGLAPVAKIECGVCLAPVCPDCRAVDGVRCKECFDAAVEQMRRTEMAARIKGPIIAIVLISFIALYGWVAASPKALECAAGATALVAFLMINGLIRERREAARSSRETRS